MNVQSEMATPDTEIRKLEPVHMCQLARILNQSNSWKQLMAMIPKENDENSYMFNNEHIVMIEEAIPQQRRSGADIFLSEWSTWGKKRPTCRSMLDLLVKAELFRAADYIAVDILKGNPPARPKFGPAAAVDVSDKVLEELLKQQAAGLLGSPAEPMSWSMHIAENPVDVAASPSERPEEHQVQSDLMKFSISERSDLMKFSKTEEEDYVLQEAKSEDIPLCVNRNAFEESKVSSAITENSESAMTIESTTDVSETTVSSERSDLSEISQNDIPVVVLQFNEKEKTDS